MKLVSWLALVILLNVIFNWATNQPQNVGDDVPAGKLSSLSFAPFREGHDPMLERFPNAQQIEEDLALMGKVTRNIRTYASAEGTMPLIPPLAKKYGLTMLQGGWLGSYKADTAEETAELKTKNDSEMAQLIRSANENPDVVKRVIVGNEVLLRGDLEPEELIEYIRKVKQAVKQPVSYADVWSEYIKHPQLIKEVDFITIHILPYWEDEPISVEDAPAHIERIYKQVQQEAKSMGIDKPILIGESGWPSGGKQRGVAIPSVVNEAKFIRDFINVANKNGFDYNIVEAFNQPWKAAFEGIIGAKWGLYDSSRQQVFPLTGKVFENPNWFKNVAASIVLFLAAVAFFRKKIVDLSTLRLLGFLVISQILTALFVLQITTLWQTSYTDFQRLQTLLIVGFNGAWGSFLLQRVIEILTKQTVSKTAKPLYYGLLIVITYAMIKTWILAWNGRYVTFPNIVTQLQVFGLFSLFLINVFSEKMSFSNLVHLTTLFDYIPRKPSHIPLVAYCLMGLSVALLMGESYSFMVSRDFIMAYPLISERLQTAVLFTVTNTQLLIWLVSLSVLAAPFFVSANTRKNGNSGIV
jgi:exo-beta-1,3-glucanase (GH17 family)